MVQFLKRYYSRRLAQVFVFFFLNFFFFLKKIIPFLLNSLGLGIHCVPEIEGALVAIAKRYQTYVNNFLQRALSKDEQYPVLFWKVLAKTFISDFEVQKEVFPPEKM